uniref:HECT E3 ubiquitin ligase putative n=1 Tax=Albugo laibachii Nc14 TaxID=890382 RepID=F0WWP2_9STRA|nr:HECT E3 ubiquitin ligase putative [Albugo laibachii Nc14]|eukprot:CCA25867.1 HECT E3 ubiquitin ligase putative [Albugo laibachii Nc14]
MEADNDDNHSSRNNPRSSVRRSRRFSVEYSQFIPADGRRASTGQVMMDDNLANSLEEIRFRWHDTDRARLASLYPNFLSTPIASVVEEVLTQDRVEVAPHQETNRRLHVNEIDDTREGGHRGSNDPDSSAGNAHVMDNDISDADWNTLEETWMPKPPRLHSGKTRCCVVCHTPLRYTTMQSWEDYLQSEEYLHNLQRNLLQDCFISGLICNPESTQCGEESFGNESSLTAGMGDLPIEHRMYKNRIMKCRQSVRDYQNMISAGVMDQSSSVRTLEEMLLDALPTPLFTFALERRFAVIYHSTGIASRLTKRNRFPKCERHFNFSQGNDASLEIHYLVINAMSALLSNFDYQNSKSIDSFKELSKMIMYFPTLSLFAYWCPPPQLSENPINFTNSAGVPDFRKITIDSSCPAEAPCAHPIEHAVDTQDNTYWQSQKRPGIVSLTLRGVSSGQLSRISRLVIHWHLDCIPQTVRLQYQTSDNDIYDTLLEFQPKLVAFPMSLDQSNSGAHDVIPTAFPADCTAIRLVLCGIPLVNRSATYAIQKLMFYAPIHLSRISDSRKNIADVCQWLMGALDHRKCNREDIMIEAITTLRSWALATGSLAAMIYFVQMLLQIGASECTLMKSATEYGILPDEKLVLDQAFQCIQSLQIYRYDQNLKRMQLKDSQKSSAAPMEVAAVFDSSHCSTGVVVEQGGLSVRTRETSYQYAAVSAGVSLGKASWSFRLDNDALDDEMTCFGAALLPVTVSGYDTSPNLWMLRGYNGNLYARGHKLTRSLCKVHPGDVVQINVDLKEGTMSYKINEADYGVVFTDLLGHEVFPAVSFYGSGKVISLLEMKKWNDIPANLPLTHNLQPAPVPLSTLAEYHSNGYRPPDKSKKPNQDNPGIQTGSDDALDSQEAFTLQLSSERDSFVLFDIKKVYLRVKGQMTYHGDFYGDYHKDASISCTLLGDDNVLWQSDSLSKSRKENTFDVEVKSCQMIQFRASCSDPNYSSVAIVAHLYAERDWECVKCGSMNTGTSFKCTLCKGMTINLEETRIQAQPDLSLLPRVYDEPSAYIHDGFPIYESVNVILKELQSLICPISFSHGDSLLRINHGCFEEPFFRQPDERVMLLLLDMFKQSYREMKCAPTFSETNKNAWSRLAEERCCSLLHLMHDSLTSIRDYQVTLDDLQITKSTTDKLKNEFESIIFAADDQGAPYNLRKLTTKALFAGISILYQSPSEFLALVLFLVRKHESEPFALDSPCHMLLTLLLDLLSQPGDIGILNLLPNDTSPSSNQNHQTVQVLTAMIKLIKEVQESGSCSIRQGAIKVLESFQVYLFAEAVQLTSTDSVPDEGNCDENDLLNGGSWKEVAERKKIIQEATLSYSSLFLNACRETINEDLERIISLDAEIDMVCLRERIAHSIPLLSNLLPWFIGCMCLLRRQTWLTRPILPILVRLLGVLDNFCTSIPVITKSESRLRQLENYARARAIEIRELEKISRATTTPGASSSVVHPSPASSLTNVNRLYHNVFSQLYTGDKDHFDGQIGFQFEAVSTFCILALGRSVNSSRNGGCLLRAHSLRLWEESSQILIAKTIVNSSSKIDSMGYVFEILQTPVKLMQGKLYRLTTHEYANSGDPWYKKENAPDEKYDNSYIRILRDCYASASCAFPSSQNLSRAAYGVPTFYVKANSLLQKLPKVIPPHGTPSIYFDRVKKSASISVSHSGNMIQANSNWVESWRSTLVQAPAFRGIHSMDFIVRSNRTGGIVSGHVCIGVTWVTQSTSDSAVYDTFLGNTNTSIGWMPSAGVIWASKECFTYGRKFNTHPGDVLTLQVDFDHHIISFAYNGQRMGNAFGSDAFGSVAVPAEKLPSTLHAGASLHGMSDAIELRPSGICRSTLQLHWLLDTMLSLSSVSSQIISTFVAGIPTDSIEEELEPWLQSPLLSGGICDQDIYKQDVKVSYQDWESATRMERHHHPVVVHPDRPFVDTLTLTLDCHDSLVPPVSDDVPDHITHITRRKLALQEDESIIKVILEWLEKNCPDRSILSRFGTFPDYERLTCAALIKHAPVHVIHEVQAFFSSFHDTESSNIGANVLQLVPSEDLVLIWKRVLSLRHWLIRMRQEYRSRNSEKDLESVRRISSRVQNKELYESTIQKKRLLAPPESFDELLCQLGERAEFLCHLDPPSEDKERLDIDSQLALSDLAEKWSSQKTPPSLEPMLERWRTLKQADSSNWSGIVSVLRAQHQWRLRRDSASNKYREGFTQENIDEDEDTSRVVHKSSFAAMLRACDLYIRNGIGAPPDLLKALLDRRQRRLEMRKFGLDAIFSLLKSLSFDSARIHAIMFLRPALRGFTNAVKQAKEYADSDVLSQDLELYSEAGKTSGGVPSETTFRATERHHYLNGLEGCHRSNVVRVQKSFNRLYSFLADLIHPKLGDAQHFDTQLKQMILSAFCLDFEPQDHSFLLKSGILEVLHDFFSVKTAKKIDQMGTPPITEGDRNAMIFGDAQKSYLWFPLSEDFVQKSILQNGFVTKRDILWLLFHSPRFACSKQWWKDHRLPHPWGTTLATFIKAVKRHTASSLALLYADYIDHFYKKIRGVQAETPAQKLLHFGVNRSQASKSTIDCVSLPALGETIDFTIEMWLHPFELSGTCSVFADELFEVGSVFLELVDQSLQLSIIGNTPRQVAFTNVLFKTHEWNHIAIVYHGIQKCESSGTPANVQLYVNGKPTYPTPLQYKKAVAAISLNTSRVGCWISDSNLNFKGIQRCFNGVIAHIRLWKLCRSPIEIEGNFEACMPTLSELTSPGMNTEESSEYRDNVYVCLWHLTEGEGVVGLAKVSLRSSPLMFEVPPNQSMNATINSCQWSKESIPVISGQFEGVSLLQRTILRRRLIRLQGIIRKWIKEKRLIELEATNLLCNHQENVNDVNFRTMIQEENAASPEKPSHRPRFRASSVVDSNYFEEQKTATAVPRTVPSYLGHLTADDIILHQKQLQKCAWIVFRFLVSVGINGIHDRREAEAKASAIYAKTKRKEKVRSKMEDDSVEDPQYVMDIEARYQSAEAASNVAKTAAGNQDLQKPALRVLWFSIEFHRKAFGILERELAVMTTLTLNAEKKERISKAQRTCRSRSTPLHADQLADLLEQHNLPSHTSNPRKDSRQMHMIQESTLEPMQVELSLFQLLTFMVSQTPTFVTLSYLSKPRILYELLQLLQIASPRCQRQVKYLLRSVCRNGFVKPSNVADLLGSESVLVEMLLDQVAESVCSTAMPMLTHALKIPNPSLELDEILLNESLSSPLGFRAGQVHLSQALESVGLLRVLLWEPEWRQKVMMILINVIRNLGPLLKHKETALSDLRTRAAVIRVVGALCVLGSQTDCIRIGGKIKVVSSASKSPHNENIGGDAAYCNSMKTDESGTSAVAKLIELNPQSASARVVFESTSKESNPTHNVQEVSLVSICPIEEIQFPSVKIFTNLLETNKAAIVPVVLQLALGAFPLQGDSDDLWRMQIQSRALLALETVLQSYGSVEVELQKCISSKMISTILETALTPIGLTSFISLPLLQERGRMILCRLFEASSPLGKEMFCGLDEPIRPVEVASDTNVDSLSAAEGTQETEAYCARLGFASTLAAMGFEFELCMTALENSRNDPNMAVEWLMSEQAVLYQERQQIQRLAAANIESRLAGKQCLGADEQDTDTSLKSKAKELESISGMPFILAYSALELNHWDPNRALEWLMEHGIKYLDQSDRMELLCDPIQIDATEMAGDGAALNDTGQSDPLVPEPAVEDSHEKSALEASQTMRNLIGLNLNVMAVTLAPILARSTAKTPSRQQVVGYAPLDPTYLRSHMILAVSDAIGPIQQISASGKIGIFRRVSKNTQSVLISFISPETGACEDEWFSADKVRRITRIYDEPVHDVSSIHKVALRTEQALITHYARRVVVKLFEHLSSGVSPSSILAFAGGPQRFINLLKLVAASDMQHRTEAFVAIEDTKMAGSRPLREKLEPLSLLERLQRMTLNILGQESSEPSESSPSTHPDSLLPVENLNDSQKLLSRVIVEECVSHLVESTLAVEQGTEDTYEHNSSQHVEFQSLHPYSGECDYLCAVSVSSQSQSLRVIFDQRTKFGPTAKLSIFEDASCENKIATFDSSSTNSHSKISDLVIQSNKFWFRFVSMDKSENFYGYRFQVKPTAKVIWNKESQVLSSPSLEWACWLLSFLLNGSITLKNRGAVHDRNIFQALVRYLRSPGAPFKNRIVRLLVQLLSTPLLFPSTEIPDVEPLKNIGKLALQRAKSQRQVPSSKNLFLSGHLLQMIELGVVTKNATKEFKKRSQAHNAQIAKIKAAVSGISVPVPPHRRDTFQCLADTASILRFLLDESSHLAQRILSSIWLDVYGTCNVLETSHPYDSYEINEVIRFPTAQSFLVFLDPRCETESDVFLELKSIALVPISHVEDTGAHSDTPKFQEFRTTRRFSGPCSGKYWPVDPIELAGDTLHVRFRGNTNVRSSYGIAITVTVVGITEEKQMEKATATDMEALQAKLSKQQTILASKERAYFEAPHAFDTQMIEWINTHVEKLEVAGSTQYIISTHIRPYQFRLNPQLDALRCSLLFDTRLEDVHIRFALIKHLNQCLHEALPYIDLREIGSSWSLASRLRQLSHCIFFDVKNKIVEAAIEATEFTGESSMTNARITLDRLQALESRDDREVEPSISGCFFAQAFRQLHDVNPAVFRRKIDSKGRLFNVKFLGEEGVDWGGVYREGTNSMVDDLFSAHFNLFVLCPNGQHDTGANRSMYLPNSKCDSPVAMQMFEFVGKLMGISLRTRGDFPFAFPSLVWKQLIGQRLDRIDLEDTDAMFVQMLDGIRNCELDGISHQEEFERAFHDQGLDLRYTAFDCTGKEVELVANGRKILVTFANRQEYCALAEQYRLREATAQISAMARGFESVFPRRVLTLLTWREMELLTCGSPKIDITLWRQHTRYEGYSESDETIQLFWGALEQFSDEQRSDFVRFAWGRSRLPRGKWAQPFKITKKGGRDAIQSLPVAHTCFFSVELPPYTSLEQMRNMLLATINFGLGGILMA